MDNSIQITFSIDIIYNFSRFIVLFAPIEYFIALFNQKGITKIPLSYFLLGIVYSIGWTILSLSDGDIFCLYFNLLQMLIFAIFLMTYLILTELLNPTAKFYHFCGWSLFFAVYYIAFSSLKETTFALLLSMITECGMYVALMQFVGMILINKDNSFIKLSMCVLMASGCLFGAIYSIFNNNLYLLIPKAIGAVVASLLIMLYAFYSKDYKDIRSSNLSFKDEPFSEDTLLLKSTAC